MKGFIVYQDYEIIENQTHIKLFGRLENGQSFIAVNKIEPYLFIKDEDLAKAKKYLEKFKVEKTPLTTFNSKKVTKISSNIHTEFSKLSSFLHKLEIDTYESDVKPAARFLIDKDILGTIEIEGEYESSERVDRIYRNPIIKPASYQPKLKIASIDTEWDKKSGELFCIGIHSENYKENFIITKEKFNHAVPCKSEEECLEKFKKALLKLDPDIITGWNIINFDLFYLKKIADKYKMPLDLGRTDENTRLRIESGFFRSSSADIPGRQVLDGLNLIKDPFIKEAPSIKNTKFASLSLEDVAQAILKTGKLIKGKKRHDEITSLYNKDNQKLIDYNLLDCKLVYDILEKTNIITLAIERSQLTGMPLDRITASIAAFDSLYIREARKRGLVSPATRFGQKEERIKGGYVQDAEPGIYNNVLVLDFKSLYPSIIRTFNIDPSSFLEKKEKNAIESPNKAYFKNSQGILPDIIQKLHEAREKAKKEERELANYSIKIIQNSFFGVLASPNCRYFNLQMANAITHFGQFIIKLTAKKLEDAGYKVIYSDTDSIFLETALEKDKANILGKEIEEKINNFYQDYTKTHYNRKSFLELEFDKQYLSLMIPQIRKKGKEGEAIGAKKRYAGLLENKGKEEIEIVGLEAIRGDWTDAAQEFQRELLNLVFHKKDPSSYIKSFIKDLESGKIDSKLIYRKSIRKELEEYTKTTPPHVKAARQLETLDSNIIEYYITTEGPEPIQKLKHHLDYEHYIKKQIEPIAQQILSLLGKNFEDLAISSKQ